MRGRDKHILTVSLAALAMLSIFAGATHVGFGAECVWHEEIMQNVTISGLANQTLGESLVIVYKGNGSYASGLSDVHYYLIYKTSEAGVRDLQAHVELAKIDDTTYNMEVYHSSRKFRIDMPWQHTVRISTTFLECIRIEEDVCVPLSLPPVNTIVDGTQDEFIPDQGAWYEEIIQSVTWKILIRYVDGFTPVIVYEGNGSYASGLSDVHFYLIYMTNETGVYDLQAHIELAKTGDTTYVMEVYHSVDIINVEMPYEFTERTPLHLYFNIFDIEAAL